MRKKIGILALTLVLLLAFSSTAFGAAKTAEEARAEVLARVNAVKDPTTAEMQYKAAIVGDPITKNIIYEKNADIKLYPASTTKLISLVIVFEGINNGKYSLEDTVTISPTVEAVNEGDLGYVAGEKRPLGELLRAMAVISANDASTAVAEFVAGSESAYVNMMNEKAAALGMTNTHFVNCTGLHDENHYTTARDMFTLSNYAYSVEGLLSLTSIKSEVFTMSTGQKTAYNTNKLLYWYPGTDGLKTGFTTPAGRCLVSTAVKDGLRLNCVVLGGTGEFSHYSESMILLNYGFSKYEMANAITAEKTTSIVNLPKGKKEEIKVCAVETVSLPTAKKGDAGYTVSFHLDKDVVAPVKKGEIIGTIKIEAHGKTLSVTDMAAAESVEKQNVFQAVFRFFRDLLR